MAVIVTIPRQGLSIESCLMAAWHKKVNDPVKKGDVLCEFETDKAVFEIEAPADGFLLKILYNPGDIVPVLAPIALIGSKNEDISTVLEEIRNKQEQSVGPVLSDKKEEESIIKKEVIQETGIVHDGTIKISPRAKKLAQKYGVNYQHIKGTGPGNRIIERDIREEMAAYQPLTPLAREGVKRGYFPPPAGNGIGGRILFKDLMKKEEGMPAREDDETIIIPVSGRRKSIADKMYLSLTTTAQLTLNTSFDATQLLGFRKKLKAQKNDKVRSEITVTDLIHFALINVLQHHPALNAHFIEKRIVQYKNIHLAFAVHTPLGIVAPVIVNAQDLTLKQLSLRSKELAERCRTEHLKGVDMTGGTFTVTNLGVMGIESFTPVLNIPEVAILGVCAVQLKPVQEDGEIVFKPFMGLSLTFDHRAIDGAPAALFLQELTGVLKNYQDIEGIEEDE